MKNLSLLLTLVVTLMLASCQQVVFDEEKPVDDTSKSHITFNVSKIEQIDFVRASLTRSQDITSLCSRLSLAVYQNGNRVSSVNQKSTDKDFGKLSVDLAEGSYFVAILAHSGDGNPTTTDAEKVVFGNGMTDTFLTSDSLIVDGNANVNVSMSRVVAMFRLITTDNIPANVKSMKFYYTGGSSTLNTLTGLGNANSRQTETIAVSDDMVGKPGTFEVYTFPKGDENVLTMQITALDANGNTVLQQTFSDVPVSCNKITQYTGEFFKGGSGSGETKSLGVSTLVTDDEWYTIAKTF